MQRADAWTPVDAERYYERCRLKTAVLFRAAGQLGETAAGLHPGDDSTLALFGERIGLAFQLLDDVLDVTGPPERTGKPRGADLLDGTVTLPLILARAQDPRLRDLDLRAIASPDDAAEVCARIEATDALEQARGQALGTRRLGQGTADGFRRPAPRSARPRRRRRRAALRVRASM